MVYRDGGKKGRKMPRGKNHGLWRHPFPRLLDGVEEQGDCLVWTKGTTWNGYGRINVDGKTQRTHRVMWEQLNGPIPEGMIILHTCDNPPCLLPAHLRLGTVKENNREAFAKGRQAEKRNRKSKKFYEDNPHRKRKGGRK